MDDHPVVRDGLRRLIESQKDLTVMADVASGSEAVALVRQDCPDMLLLDMTMPKGSGLDVLRSLESIKPTPLVLLLTAGVERAELLDALDLGAKGIVLKDASTDALLKAIRCVLSGEMWVDRVTLADWAKHHRSGSADRFNLTPREIQVISEIVSGSQNKDIATKLAISEETVKRHLSNIYDKLGVSNRLELALFAISHKLVTG